MTANILRKYKIKDLKGLLKTEEEHFLNQLTKITKITFCNNTLGLYNTSEFICMKNTVEFEQFLYFTIKHKEYINKYFSCSIEEGSLGYLFFRKTEE